MVYNKNAKITVTNYRSSLRKDMVKVMKNEKIAVKKNKFWYVFGSAAVTVGAMLVLPKIIEKGARFFYESRKTRNGLENDDWGPEIVKTSELKKEEK